MEKSIQSLDEKTPWSLILLKNLLIIFTLGISGGLPLALLLSTLKAFLYEQGSSLELLGFLAIVSLPYSIKFIFAPILDSMRIPFLSNLLGFRRSWIVLMQISLIFSIFFIGTAGELQNLKLIILFAGLTAVFSACQDVVIDGYRIELFEKRDQGLATSFYIFGYRFGLLISGALALYLADVYGWKTAFLIISITILICCFVTLFASETRVGFKEKSKGFIDWFKEFVINPFKDFAKNNNWITIIILIITFKLGDAYAGSLTIPFLLEIGYSKTQIAAIAKTFGLAATLFGVLAGGLIIRRIGIFKCLHVAAFLQMASNLSFAYLSGIDADINTLYLVIFAENFSGGIGDAVFVAYLSSLCNIKFSATQYAILTSFASISRSLLSTSSGLIVVAMGWFNFFVFSIFLSIPTFVCLYLIYKGSKKQ